MTEIPAYIYSAVGLLLCFLLAIRWAERVWFAPSLIFVAAFFSHAFLAPLVYLDLGAINEVNLPDAISYALVCFFSMLIGYLIVALSVKQVPRLVPLHPLLSSFSLKITQIIVVVLIGVLYFIVIKTGALYQSKGSSAYASSPGLLQRIGIVNLILPALLLAVLMSPKNFKLHGSLSFSWFLFFSFIAVSTYSFLLFERLQTVRLILYFLIFYHFCLRPIPAKYFFALLFFVILLMGFASARSLGTGFMDAGVVTVLKVVWSSLLESPSSIIIALVAAIPGQEVFAEVINLVPSQYPYRYGGTYLDSLLSLLMPRFLGIGSYEEIATPAYWFKEAFAPNLEGHGFDFSMLSEAYINFGSNMWIVFLIVGMVISRASLTIRTSKSPMWVYLSILVLVALTLGLRSDSNTVFKAIVYFYIPIPLILLFEKLLRAAVSQKRKIA